MTIRQTRRLLWVTAALCIAAAVTVVTLGVLAPFTTTNATPQRLAAPEARAESKDSRAPRAALELVADLDLRRPLFDPPPPPPPALVTAPLPPAMDLPPEPVTLAGTIIEQGRSYAIFITPAGAMEVRAVGEKTGTAEVVSIDDNSVTLSAGGRNFIVKVLKENKEGKG